MMYSISSLLSPGRLASYGFISIKPCFLLRQTVLASSSGRFTSFPLRRRIGDRPRRARGVCFSSSAPPRFGSNGTNIAVHCSSASPLPAKNAFLTPNVKKNRKIFASPQTAALPRRGKRIFFDGSQNIGGYWAETSGMPHRLVRREKTRREFCRCRHKQSNTGKRLKVFFARRVRWRPSPKVGRGRSSPQKRSRRRNA